jgi:serine/threonine-protein kinase
VADPNSPSQQLVGAVLNGRWKLVRLVGEGGMGAVFEADSLRGEGKRAIKLLHQEFSKEEPILQRFFAEAQTSQSLSHPNIARVFESGRAEDGTPYLVMELLTGQPLSAWIDSGQAISPQQAAPIIYGVLQALHLAHQRRVIHRDMKPDNLFMTRDAAGQYVVKVLDFGIAKVMDAAGGMGNKTRTGVLLGTPGYMSPEQIKNSKAVDARSDLWAVGIIFYEMLTQQIPFHAENEFARLTAVLTDDPTPIEVTAPHLVAWSGFFRKALAKEPIDRFQTAEEMANALMMVSRGGAASNPIAPAAPAGGGNATVAMAAVPEWNTPQAQPIPLTHVHARPGTATVPSSPSPQTFQGAQQQPIAPAPQAFQGAQPQPIAPAPPTYQGAQQQQPMTPSPYAQHAPSYPPQGPGTMPGAQQHVPLPMAEPRRPGGTQHSAVDPVPMGPGPGQISGGRGPTHISAQVPPGMAMQSVPPPNIEIVSAPPLRKGVPVWAVAAIGTACLVVGFLIGFLVGR